MEHPDEKYRKKQSEFLKQCPTEDREMHATIFRIGNASYIYNQIAYDTSEKKLKLYYDEWLEGLPANIRESMEKHGFEKCKSMLPFTRYVNERNDIGMDEWMREHLTAGDYEFYKTNGQETIKGDL